jgi:hypothetical protein
VAERQDEIHVRGRVYTFSRHLRASLHRHPEATIGNVEYVLLNPARQEPVGARRFIYWGYLPQVDQFMKIVEDRLTTGEYQILSAYCPIEQPTREEIYGQNAT